MAPSKNCNICITGSDIYSAVPIKAEASTTTCKNSLAKLNKGCG